MLVSSPRRYRPAVILSGGNGWGQLEKLKLTILDYGITSTIRLPSIHQNLALGAICSIGYNVAAIGRSRLITLCSM